MPAKRPPRPGSLTKPAPEETAAADSKPSDGSDAPGAGDDTAAAAGAAPVSPSGSDVTAGEPATSPELAAEQTLADATAKELPLGTRVDVDGYSCQGTVRFVGLVGNKCRVGVQLDHASGKNDGEALGTRFFQCPPKKGTFVFAHKVKAVAGAERVAVVGVRVRVDTDGVDGCEGKVEFVGQIGGKERVGVALNEKKGKNDGMVRGERFFECPQGHGIFVYREHVTVV